jgi:hypothetical protein
MNDQLIELRTTVTDTDGNEIRVYDEYRYSKGYGNRIFIGYLIDNGRDRRQVPTWLDVLKVIGPYLDESVSH